MRLAEAVHTHVAFDTLRAVLLAGPGFVPRDFQAVLLQQAEEKGWKTLLEHKHKIALTHASTGQKYALTQVMQTPAVKELVSTTGAASESKIMEDYYEMLNTDPDRAFYGTPPSTSPLFAIYFELKLMFKINLLFNPLLLSLSMFQGQMLSHCRCALRFYMLLCSCFHVCCRLRPRRALRARGRRVRAPGYGRAL